MRNLIKIYKYKKNLETLHCLSACGGVVVTFFNFLLQGPQFSSFFFLSYIFSSPCFFFYILSLKILVQKVLLFPLHLCFLVIHETKYYETVGSKLWLGHSTNKSLLPLRFFSIYTLAHFLREQMQKMKNKLTLKVLITLPLSLSFSQLCLWFLYMYICLYI